MGSLATSVKETLGPLVRSAVKQSLIQGGSALGRASGVPSGGVFGKEMGARLSKIIGSGDYESNVSANDLIHPRGMSPSMSFGDTSDVIRVRRREFITDVLNSSVVGTFSNSVYPINAGVRNTFPYLSQVAANYEEYCINGLVFEFISSSSSLVTGTALGTVIAAMEYNSAAPAFANKYTMENSAHAISTRLDKNLMYGVECARGANAQNCYYTRSGESVLPLTTTDLGQFQLAIAPSSAVPAGTVLGELWVTYDISLKRPILSPSRFALGHFSRGTPSAANPFGSTAIVASNNGSIDVVATGTTLTFTNMVVGDSYMIDWVYTGTVGAVLVYPVPSTPTGFTANACLYNDSVNIYYMPPAGTTSVVAAMKVCITATATTGTFSLGTAGTLPGTPQLAETIITSLGNGIIPSNW